MGLAMVHGIVKRLEGHISVYSEPGHGTSILVCLPRIDGVASVSGKKPKDDIQVGDEAILIVDDDAILQMEKDMVAQLGYKPTCPTSGESALEIFNLQPESFDLVITDMTMPRMTGAELSQKILSVRSSLKGAFFEVWLDTKTAAEYNCCYPFTSRWKKNSLLMPSIYNVCI